MAYDKAKLDKRNKYVDNPRQITEKQFKLLDEHIKEFGDLSGVIYCTKQKAFVGGNMRSEIMDGAEIEIIERFNKPTKNKTLAHGFIKFNGEKFAYREVAFNKSEFKKACIVANNDGGSFDWDILFGSGEWQDEPLADWGLDIPVFESVEDETETQDAEPQIDKAEELNKVWQVKQGDLWQIGEHRLLCGDSTKREDVERLVDGSKVSCVLTDPPYGQNQDGIPNDEPEIHKNLLLDTVGNLPIENGIVVSFQSPRTFVDWLDAIRTYKHKFERMLWMYKAAQCTFPWRGWILKSESILISTIGEGQWQDIHPYSHDCYYLSEVSGELDKDSGWHGSVKPLKVVSDLLSRICPQGAKVYDPFVGSGTTFVACQNLKRKCYAIEISAPYCSVILERMSQAFPGLEIKRIEQSETASV